MTYAQQQNDLLANNVHGVIADLLAEVAALKEQVASYEEDAKNLNDALHRAYTDVIRMDWLETATEWTRAKVDDTRIC